MNQQPKEPDELELPLAADHPNQLSFLDAKPKKDEPEDKQ